MASMFRQTLVASFPPFFGAAVFHSDHAQIASLPSALPPVLKQRSKAVVVYTARSRLLVTRSNATAAKCRSHRSLMLATHIKSQLPPTWLRLMDPGVGVLQQVL